MVSLQVEKGLGLRAKYAGVFACFEYGFYKVSVSRLTKYIPVTNNKHAVLPEDLIGVHIMEVNQIQASYLFITTAKLKRWIPLRKIHRNDINLLASVQSILFRKIRN